MTDSLKNGARTPKNLWAVVGGVVGACLGAALGYGVGHSRALLVSVACVGTACGQAANPTIVLAAECWGAAVGGMLGAMATSAPTPGAGARRVAGAAAAICALTALILLDY